MSVACHELISWTLQPETFFGEYLLYTIDLLSWIKCLDKKDDYAEVIFVRQIKYFFH